MDFSGVQSFVPIPISSHTCPTYPHGSAYLCHSLGMGTDTGMLKSIWGLPVQISNNITWSEIDNGLMAGLIHRLNNHTDRQLSAQQQHSLEDVYNYMQRALIHLSAEFQWGSFTSIPSILQHVLQHNITITSCARRCSVSTHPSTQERANKHACDNFS
jgi:hypothetical protein